MLGWVQINQMSAVLQKPTRPILRYHGGKWDLAHWIISHFPPHVVYVEPFGGAASVMLLKPRSHSEVYNDLNSELVNLFRILRDPMQAEELTTLLVLTPYSREEFEAAQERTQDPIESARRLIVRSRFGFNSGAFERTGFRANNHFAHKPIQRVWAEFPIEISAFTQRLSGVVIEGRPAIQVIKQHDTEQTLFYVDPPYLHETRGTTRYAFDMTDDEHKQLAEGLCGAIGMVIVSGYDTQLYAELFKGWHTVKKVAKTDGGYRTEVLWLNASAQSGLEKNRTPLFNREVA